MIYHRCSTVCHLFACDYRFMSHSRQQHLIEWSTISLSMLILSPLYSLKIRQKYQKINQIQLTIKTESTMKLLALLVIFAVIFTLYTVETSVGLFPNSPEYQCVPGDVWFKECNKCFCDDDSNQICTEMACY